MFTTLISSNKYIQKLVIKLLGDRNLLTNELSKRGCVNSGLILLAKKSFIFHKIQLECLFIYSQDVDAASKKQKKPRL